MIDSCLRVPFEITPPLLWRGETRPTPLYDLASTVIPDGRNQSSLIDDVITASAPRVRWRPSRHPFTSTPRMRDASGRRSPRRSRLTTDHPTFWGTATIGPTPFYHPSPHSITSGGRESIARNPQVVRCSLLFHHLRIVPPDTLLRADAESADQSDGRYL